MTTKICASCKRTKPTTEFRRSKTQPDRLTLRCTVCIDSTVCVICRERPKRRGGSTCNSCHHDEYKETRLAARRRRWEERRQRVLLAYGGKCVICGEDDLDVLLLDHVNDDGAEHRARVGNDKVYRDLENEGYPPIVQVLCANDDLRKRRGRFGSSGA